MVEEPCIVCRTTPTYRSIWWYYAGIIPLVSCKESALFFCGLAITCTMFALFVSPSPSLVVTQIRGLFSPLPTTVRAFICVAKIITTGPFLPSSTCIEQSKENMYQVRRYTLQYELDTSSSAKILHTAHSTSSSTQLPTARTAADCSNVRCIFFFRAVLSLKMEPNGWGGGAFPDSYTKTL